MVFEAEYRVTGSQLTILRARELPEWGCPMREDEPGAVSTAEGRLILSLTGHPPIAPCWGWAGHRDGTLSNDQQARQGERSGPKQIQGPSQGKIQSGHYSGYRASFGIAQAKTDCPSGALSGTWHLLLLLIHPSEIMLKLQDWRQHLSLLAASENVNRNLVSPLITCVRNFFGSLVFRCFKNFVVQVLKGKKFWEN